MQNIQTATVRHAHHDFFQPQLRPALHHLFQRRDDSLTTIKAKTLGANIFFMEILFKIFGRNQTFINRHFTAFGEGRLVADAFDAFLNPSLLLRVLDMHELNPDGAAISIAHNRENFAQSCDFSAQNKIDKDRPIHIAFVKPIRGGV